MEREDFRMKENKMSRRSFLKAGAFASAAGMLAAAPAAANAAAPNAAKAAEEENGLLGVFGGNPSMSSSSSATAWVRPRYSPPDSIRVRWRTTALSSRAS